MMNRAATAQIPLIRLAHPQAFCGFLESMGAPADSLLQRIGLPVYCYDPGAFVPLRLAWALFDSAAQTAEPALGWHVGRFSGVNRLSAPFLRRIEHAPTLYRALHRLVQLVGTEASHLRIGIQERRNDIVLYTHYPKFKDWPGYQSSQAYQLEVYIDIVRHYLGSEWVPPEIGIESASVPTVAQEHFPGSRIRPSQMVGYLTVPRRYLLHGAIGGVQPVPEETPLHLARDFSFVATLETLVRAYLEDGYPSASKMAPLLDTSARTLFRRLSEQNLTYQSLIDKVRFEKATELLQQPDLPIGEISRAVGFDDPSHFSRMFRRVGGLSPEKFRASLRA